jgi:hypothetical protein
VIGNPILKMAFFLSAEIRICSKLFGSKKLTEGDQARQGVGHEKRDKGVRGGSG